MTQRRKSRGPGSDTVPFGIRALESGIGIEGVWVSRGNTPELVSRDNSAASSLWEHTPKGDNDLDIEKQDLHQYYYSSTSNASAVTEGPSRASFDRPSLPNNSSPSYNIRDRSPDAQITKPARSRHPPLSYTRYEGNPYILRRQSSSTTTLQGLEAIHKASTSIRDQQSRGSAESSFSSNRLSNSAADVEPISASAPDLLTAQPNSKPIKLSSSSDLELLNSHRVSQAAETGQLTPRGRRPGKAYSVDFAAPSARTSKSAERSDYFGVQQKAVRPSLETTVPMNPFSSPKIDALPLAVRRTSMPDVIPFAQFCKMAPPSPSLESSRSNSTDSIETVTPTSDDHNDHDYGALSTIIPASEGAAALKLPPPKRGSFEKRISQVVRGFGTGFEILKPGSFNPPIPKDWKMEKQRRAPPVSVHNASRGRSSSTGSERKLQKKRRPSVDSIMSSNTSRRSRISLLL